MCVYRINSLSAICLSGLSSPLPVSVHSAHLPHSRALPICSVRLPISSAHFCPFQFIRTISSLFFSISSSIPYTMEKFSNWRDKGTGISPFMPNPQPSKSFAQKITSPFVFLIKLPLILLLVGLNQIFSLTFLLSKILNFSIDLSVQDIKKNNLAKTNAQKPNLNDLVFVNYISPIDSLLVLLSLHSSVKSLSQVVFLVPDTNGNIYQFTVWQFVGFTFIPPSSYIWNSAKKVDYNNLKDKVVFYFYESTPTNNKSVLSPILPSDQFVSKFKSVKLLILKLSPNWLTLPIPIESKLAYWFKLIVSGPKLIKFRIVVDDGSTTTQLSLFIQKNLNENSWNTIPTDLNLNAKIKFYNYYIENKK